MLVYNKCRLWRVVRREVQIKLEAKRVHQSVWHVLCKVQVCSTGDLREQRNVWEVLHGYDHSWQQAQVPLGSHDFHHLQLTTINKVLSNYEIHDMHLSFWMFRLLKEILDM
jgi:hypothetical protein